MICHIFRVVIIIFMAISFAISPLKWFHSLPTPTTSWIPMILSPHWSIVSRSSFWFVTISVVSLHYLLQEIVTYEKHPMYSQTIQTSKGHALQHVDKRMYYVTDIILHKAICIYGWCIIIAKSENSLRQQNVVYWELRVGIFSSFMWKFFSTKFYASLKLSTNHCMPFTSNEFISIRTAVIVCLPNFLQAVCRANKLVVANNKELKRLYLLVSYNNTDRNINVSSSIKYNDNSIPARSLSRRRRTLC